MAQQNRVMDELMAARQSFDEDGQQGDGLADEMAQQAKDALAQLELWIIRNPGAGLVAALTSGLILGWLLKRR